MNRNDNTAPRDAAEREHLEFLRSTLRSNSNQPHPTGKG